MVKGYTRRFTAVLIAGAMVTGVGMAAGYAQAPQRPDRGAEVERGERAVDPADREARRRAAEARRKAAEARPNAPRLDGRPVAPGREARVRATGEGRPQLTPEERRARAMRLREARQEGRLRGAEGRGVKDLDERRKAMRQERLNNRGNAAVGAGINTRRRLHKLENDHNRRLAQLQRILEVAETAKDDAAVARVRGLMKAEEEKFMKSSARLKSALKRRKMDRAATPMSPERADKLRKLRAERAERGGEAAPTRERPAPEARPER